MASFSLPASHSCQHCQKLVLDLSKDRYRWWKRTSGPTKEGIEAVGGTPSQRVKEYLDSLLQAMPDRNSYDPLNVLLGIVLFDFSLADVRKAAGEGCYLCECILEDPQSNIEESSLLAAKLEGDLLRFGVPEAHTGFHKDARNYEIGLTTFQLRSVFHFQIIAAAGKLTNSPRQSKAPTRLRLIRCS